MASRCCSLRCGAILVVALAIFIAALPTMMSALLRHMFTAPNQKPWPNGTLRLIDVNGMPAQPLNSVERANDLISPDKNKFLYHENDVWIVSYVKSGTTWLICILAALYDDESQHYCGNIQKTTRKFCPQPELRKYNNNIRLGFSF